MNSALISGRVMRAVRSRSAPDIPGIAKSISIKSMEGSFAMRASAAFPPSASSTSKFMSRSSSAVISRTSTLSSTTSNLAEFITRVGKHAPWCRGRVRCRFSHVRPIPHEAVDLRQAEPGAVTDFLGREKWVECARKDFLIHPDTGVTNRQHHIFSGPKLLTLRSVFLLELRVGGLDNDFAAMRH